MSDDHPAQKDLHPETDDYCRAGRSTYLRVDLDVIYNNINILKKNCAPHTEVIAVVKGNALGHGSVQIAKFLEAKGIKHFGVATTDEGLQIREAEVQGYIQIFGNASSEDIPALLEYNLVPTVADIDFLQQWMQSTTTNTEFKVVNGHTGNKRPVVLKIDTGLSRNGCQPEDLSQLAQYCRDNDVSIHSIMTHFSQAMDSDFTKQQLDTFMAYAAQYRESEVKLHVSNSAAILNGYGTDLDFIRPGICMYGFPPAVDNATVHRVQSLGLRPALSWLAHPTLVKLLPPGRHVGYDNTYTSKEAIATFSLGTADGLNTFLWNKTVVSVEKEDVTCPVVGRLSTDAITVRLDKMRPKSTTFHIITDDYTSPNSATQIASTLEILSHDVTVSLAVRLPRVYVSGGQTVAVTRIVPNHPFWAFL